MSALSYGISIHTYEDARVSVQRGTAPGPEPYVSFALGGSSLPEVYFYVDLANVRFLRELLQAAVAAVAMAEELLPPPPLSDQGLFAVPDVPAVEPVASPAEDARAPAREERSNYTTLAPFHAWVLGPRGEKGVK